MLYTYSEAAKIICEDYKNLHTLDECALLHSYGIESLEHIFKAGPNSDGLYVCEIDPDVIYTEQEIKDVLEHWYALQIALLATKASEYQKYQKRLERLQNMQGVE